MSRPRVSIARFLGVALIVAGAALAARVGTGHGGTAGLGGFEPLTPWQRPSLELPPARPLDYRQLAETGLGQAVRWREGSWYCEYLGCSHGPYPLVSLWGEVPMFEAIDALDIGFPSRAHRALVDRFARANERYWDSALGGYAPYPGDRDADVQAFFDDNGWEGLAFYDAYLATRERRWLYDAQRAFRFIAARGWDRNGGGGMWWNTSHPYHSGPALASDSLLGILLYRADHEAWQLVDVRTYVDWANANDNHDERQLYLEKPNEPESVNDYVQAPLIYAQYLLCRDGQGESYCVQAGRVAATMAEEDVDAYGYKYNYGPEYDAIFMQWMMAYGQQTGQRYWIQLAEVNAAAAAENAGDGQGLWLSSWWGGPIADPETHPDMFRTMAATTSLFAWTAAYSEVGR
ncbi:MAG TPA: glycoside hydrolase family 76 protein [Solirubrobacteraceae bacterium]|nr:glycoside hydrolase family 76 protein [Solirubrobacteraceae bacterium]